MSSFMSVAANASVVNGVRKSGRHVGSSVRFIWCARKHVGPARASAQSRTAQTSRLARAEHKPAAELRGPTVPACRDGAGRRGSTEVRAVSALRRGTRYVHRCSWCRHEQTFLPHILGPRRVWPRNIEPWTGRSFSRREANPLWLPHESMSNEEGGSVAARTHHGRPH
jgi:hypothetical protein